MHTTRATVAAVAVATAVLAFPVAPAFAADPAPSPSASVSEAKSVTTASGLNYIDLKEGTGPAPKAGQQVVVTYTMTDAATGREIEKTRGQMFGFVIGKGQAMKGMEEGVLTMKAGGERKLVIPPTLALGEQATDKTGPNATLIVVLTLVEIKQP